MQPLARMRRRLVLTHDGAGRAVVARVCVCTATQEAGDGGPRRWDRGACPQRVARDAISTRRRVHGLSYITTTPPAGVGGRCGGSGARAGAQRAGPLTRLNAT